ncbi:hypothetical protein FDENT_6694 [Fusarium denticulatum]|uniref:Uncharacterized protein n=1 Tax=Fusarium denticulatum TaxID=48507 RepID=A0A8H5UBL0_9HYPO|nr:hypothetical protein FDENT_6694 [Fusarium denticulatum]
MPITETFFPAFLQACDDYPHDILDIQLTCGICHEQMTFKDEDDPHLPPSKKGSLIHMDGEKSIARIEDILKLWHNRWHCFDCDMDMMTSWLQVMVKVSQDSTELVDNGQLLRIWVEYEGKAWGDPSRYIDCRFVEQQPLPIHLEIPVKIIEKGILKAHDIAVPAGSTAFKCELRVYEPRYRKHEILVWERHHFEQTEQDMRDHWVGNRKLMLLELAFDLRDVWSDENVRKKINERARRERESVLRRIEDNEDEEVDDEDGDDEDELPDVYIV